MRDQKYFHCQLHAFYLIGSCTTFSNQLSGKQSAQRFFTTTTENTTTHQLKSNCHQKRLEFILCLFTNLT